MSNLHKALTTLTTNDYNGYSNYETWNITLWLLNDETLYKLSQCCTGYANFLALLSSKKPDATFFTQDYVRFDDPKVNIAEVNKAVWSI